MTTLIRAAVEGDLEAILTMNNDAVPEVSDLDRAALEELWAMSSSLVVADSGGRVAGFLVLLEGPGQPYRSLNYRWFSDRYDRFSYVDRVVVGASHRGAGLGRGFYEWAIDAGRGRFPVLCAEVNTRPRNDVSLAFHDTMGFTAVGEQDTEGGTKTVVMLARPLGDGS